VVIDTGCPYGQVTDDRIRQGTTRAARSGVEHCTSTTPEKVEAAQFPCS
jgi:hypothetical protein